MEQGSLGVLLLVALLTLGLCEATWWLGGRLGRRSFGRTVLASSGRMALGGMVTGALLGIGAWATIGALRGVGSPWASPMTLLGIACGFVGAGIVAPALAHALAGRAEGRVESEASEPGHRTRTAA